MGRVTDGTNMNTCREEGKAERAKWDSVVVM